MSVISRKSILIATASAAFLAAPAVATFTSWGGGFTSGWGSYSPTHRHYCNCGHSGSCGSTSSSTSSGGTTSGGTTSGGTTSGGTTSGGTTSGGTTSGGTTSGGTTSSTSTGGTTTSTSGGTTTTSTSTGGTTTSSSSGGGSSSGGPTPVPEPGILGLFALGLGGIAVARRRRSRKQTTAA